MRRVEKAKKAKSFAQIVKENDELKQAANKHDDELSEMDIKLREKSQKLESALTKVKVLEAEKESEYIENDDWVPNRVGHAVADPCGSCG